MLHVSGRFAVTSRRALSFTVCVRDDDAGTFAFHTTSDFTAFANRVASAVSRGRRVRCYLLAADPDGPSREERYLAMKGYTRGVVEL
jgi:hypothetical protein